MILSQFGKLCPELIHWMDLCDYVGYLGSEGELGQQVCAHPM